MLLMMLKKHWKDYLSPTKNKDCVRLLSRIKLFYDPKKSEALQYVPFSALNVTPTNQKIHEVYRFAP